MIIIGAGMSGLLAANMFRKQQVQIIEKQKSLPNNHKALLRFRSDAVENASGVPFKKVFVRKQINYHGDIFQQPTMCMANEYCHKVTGKYDDRSIWNLEPAYRYIAPENFISLLSKNCNIEFNTDATDGYKKEHAAIQPIISTIPMANLMDLLGWVDKPVFDYKTIWTVVFDIDSPDVDLYQTTYYPNIDLPIYRISITGKKIIAEFIRAPMKGYEYKGGNLSLLEYIMHFINHDFGLVHSTASDFKVSSQKYGKLIPISDEIRKQFITWATNCHNIYSLGRWATHRQLLMDDVVKDIHIIGNLINSGNYSK